MSTNLFKSAVGGYNKSEVDTYILHVSRKTERERKDYERKIELLEAEITKLKNEKTNVLSMLREDEAIITAFRSKITETTEETIAEPEKKDEKADEECSELLEKSKRYDEISRQLGEIIIKANANAAEIILAAEADARAIRERAADDIKKTAAEIAEKLSQLANNAEALLSKADTNDSTDGE